MRLDRISITNMRLIGEQTKELVLDSTKNVVILLGDNGFGKTTILDAIATVMAPYSAQFPGISNIQLSDLDVHIDRRGRRSKYLTVSAELSDNGIAMSSIRFRKGITAQEEDSSRCLNAVEASSRLLRDGTVIRVQSTRKQISNVFSAGSI